MTGGSSSGGLEGDVVSEAFELGDEAAGGVFGVEAGVVVAAEFAVELAGCERPGDALMQREARLDVDVPAVRRVGRRRPPDMCQQAQRIECLTAPSARPSPRRGRRRWYL